jgi:glutamine synthetase
MAFGLPLDPGFRKEVVELWLDDIEDRLEQGKIEDAEKKALAYCDKVKSHFDEIRYHADKLEILVEDELWPLPKFRELLFTR